VNASHSGQLVWLSSQYAIRAPAAPIAPNARFSTPVARYSTTSPTPESAYTPPNARPITMKGLSSCQSTPNTLSARTSAIEAFRCRHLSVVVALVYLPVLSLNFFS